MQWPLQMTAAVCYTKWAEPAALHKQESLHGHILDTEAHAKQLADLFDVSMILGKGHPGDFPGS